MPDGLIAITSKISQSSLDANLIVKVDDSTEKTVALGLQLTSLTVEYNTILQGIPAEHRDRITGIGGWVVHEAIGPKCPLGRHRGPTLDKIVARIVETNMLKLAGPFIEG